jgi:hypothetical protein
MSSSDNIKIIKITKANWFSAIGTYPQTVGEFKLFVTMIDRMGMFEKFELSKIINMNVDRLNLLLGTLLLSNNLYSQYENYISRNVLTSFYKKLFTSVERDYIHQLIQDSSDFINDIIRDTKKNTSYEIVKLHFVRHMKAIASSDYYSELLKEETDITNRAVSHVDKYIHQAVLYINEQFMGNYRDLNHIAKYIFSSNTSTSIVVNNFNRYVNKNNINVKDIMVRGCDEIELYKEQIENNYVIKKDHDMVHRKMIKNIDGLLRKMDCDVIGNIESVIRPSYLEPFIVNRLVENDMALIDIIHYIMVKYKDQIYMVDTKKDITIKKLYNMHKKKGRDFFMSYDECCMYMKVTNEFPKCVTLEYIYRLISLALNVEIRLYNNRGNIISFNNTYNTKLPPVKIYVCRSIKKGFVYLTLCDQDEYKQIVTKEPIKKREIKKYLENYAKRVSKISPPRSYQCRV